MSVKLRTDDRRAIDLLLDRATVAAKSNGAALYADGEPTTLRHRVHCVSQLLHVLDSLAAPEPPRNLVANTMKRLDAASQGRGHAPSEARHLPGSVMDQSNLA